MAGVAAAEAGCGDSERRIAVLRCASSLADAASRRGDAVSSHHQSVRSPCIAPHGDGDLIEPAPVFAAD